MSAQAAARARRLGAPARATGAAAMGRRLIVADMSPASRLRGAPNPDRRDGGRLPWRRPIPRIVVADGSAGRRAPLKQSPIFRRKSRTRLPAG
jgi:hypothetical protein